MNVIFEKAPTNFNTPAKNYELWDLFQRAKEAKSMDEFRKVDLPSFTRSDWFVIGFGSGHIWVHERKYHDPSQLEKDRLLIITEN